MRTIILSVVIAGCCLAQFPAPFSIQNDTTTGTSLFKLADLNGSGQAIVSNHSNTAGAIGVVTGNAGTTGTSYIAFAGPVALYVDATTTVGHCIVRSTTTDGEGHDTGSACSTPPTTGEFIGIVITASTGANSVSEVVLKGAFSAGGGAGSQPQLTDWLTTATSTVLKNTTCTTSTPCTPVVNSHIGTPFASQPYQATLTPGTSNINCGGSPCNGDVYEYIDSTGSVWTFLYGNGNLLSGAFASCTGATCTFQASISDFPSGTCGLYHWSVASGAIVSAPLTDAHGQACRVANITAGTGLMNSGINPATISFDVTQSQNFIVKSSTVAGLPASPGAGALARVTDGNPDCTTGGGSNVIYCQYNGSVWGALGGATCDPFLAGNDCRILFTAANSAATSGQSGLQFYPQISTGGSTAIADPSTTFPAGSLVLTTGTTSGGLASILYENTTGQNHSPFNDPIVTTGTWKWVSVGQLSATTSLEVLMGLTNGSGCPSNSSGTTGNNECIGIEFDTGQSDTNWMCVYKAQFNTG